MLLSIIIPNYQFLGWYQKCVGREKCRVIELHQEGGRDGLWKCMQGMRCPDLLMRQIYQSQM
jgi:hypothetical protein